MYLKQTLEKIQTNDFVIQVFGLGYVGFPLAMRLAISGFKVIGIDTDQKKIENLKNGVLGGSQTNQEDAFLESKKNGTFIPSQRTIESNLPRIGIICVPTPISKGKIHSEDFVFSAVKEFLHTSKSGDLIILESSVKVGTTELIKKIIESTGYKIGKNFGLCFCPERIDPLNQKWKLENIPRVIFASDDVTFQIAQKIYEPVNNSELFRVNSPKIAEVVKSFENAFRLVNVSFVNELAILCDKLNINVNEVIDAASTKPFAFIPHFPGAGVGGHCVPKDPRFLLESAKENELSFSSIENALKINSLMPKYIVESITKTLDELKLRKNVLVCGLSYKPDMADMRDAPGFKILNELNKNHFNVGAFDPYFQHELIDMYLIENNLEKLDCEFLSNLDDSINDYDCICIVQHHKKTKSRIRDIYTKSLTPFIYDCQNKMLLDSNSKTILKCLGTAAQEKKYLISKNITAAKL